MPRICTIQVFEWVKEHGGEPIIPFSGIFENKIFDMPNDEKEKYCKEVRIYQDCCMEIVQLCYRKTSVKKLSVD